MYAFIKGKIEHKELGLLEIDVNGVGYEVCVTDKVFSDCREGEDIVLYTAFIVKEDANTLYGFETRAEKRMFYRLIGVYGVGAKYAMAILGAMTLPEIASAVASGDAKAFSRTPGIGKKTAERIILELKGKLDFGFTPEQTVAIKENMDAKQEAVDSLMGLGFSMADATEAVNAVSVLADTAEEFVVLALKRLGM